MDLVPLPTELLPRRAAASVLVLYTPDEAIRRLVELNRRSTGRPIGRSADPIVSTKLNHAEATRAYRRTLACLLGDLKTRSPAECYAMGQSAVAAAERAKDVSGLTSIILSTIARADSDDLTANGIALLVKRGFPSRGDGGLRSLPFIDSTGRIRLAS